MPSSIAHRAYFAVDVGIRDIFGGSLGSQLLDEILEAGIHFHFTKSLGYTSPGRSIETLDDGEKVFETEPYVGNGDLCHGGVSLAR